MITLISTAIVLISMADPMNAAAAPTAAPQWQAESSAGRRPSTGRRPTDDSMSSLLNVLQSAHRNESPWERATRTVFVVPGPDLAPEGLTQITEDMAIMCRLLDKALAWALQAGDSQISETIPFDPAGVRIADNRFWTQGLYLDGHGAIFFLPVDFPLFPPRQEQTPAPSEPSSDPLWSQTADELRGVPQEHTNAVVRRYDAQKVDNLKTALIAVLRHAANLRTRGPQDAITIVLTSRSNQSDHRSVAAGPGRWSYPSDGQLPQQAAESAPDSPPDWPAALILRTTKGDVDAFAKGGQTLEQFTGNVQILKSWITPGQDAIPRDMTRSGISLPSRNVR